MKPFILAASIVLSSFSASWADSPKSPVMDAADVKVETVKNEQVAAVIFGLLSLFIITGH